MKINIIIKNNSLFFSISKKILSIAVSIFSILTSIIFLLICYIYKDQMYKDNNSIHKEKTHNISTEKNYQKDAILNLTNGLLIMTNILCPALLSIIFWLFYLIILWTNNYNSQKSKKYILIFTHILIFAYFFLFLRIIFKLSTVFYSIKLNTDINLFLDIFSLIMTAIIIKILKDKQNFLFYCCLSISLWQIISSVSCFSLLA